MLKDKNIKVNISYRNITHYLKLGYKPILNQELVIETEHLPTSSHFIIQALCQICNNEISLRFHKYIENKKRHGFYSCRKCSRQKAALTSIEKYGVDNYSKTDEYKKRVEKTNIEKYGYKTNLLSPEYQSNIKNILKNKYGTENFYEINRINKDKKSGFILKENLNSIRTEIIYSEDLYTNELITKDYLLYRNEVRRITKSNIKKLLLNWDGLDYYDNEYIMENYRFDHNDPNYPTIDHKVSVYYGFKNNILPSEIANITNLCITKRSINSKKRDIIEEDFIYNI